MRKIETIDEKKNECRKMTYDITGWSCDNFMKIFFDLWNELLEINLCTKFYPNWSKNEENRDN